MEGKGSVGRRGGGEEEEESEETHDRCRMGSGGGGVASDPYWPHQALAGRCTPPSGQRSQRGAARRPRSAASPTSPRRASCPLDGGKNRGEEVEEEQEQENRGEGEEGGMCV